MTVYYIVIKVFSCKKKNLYSLAQVGKGWDEFPIYTKFESKNKILQ